MLVYAKVYNSQLELTPNKSRHIIPTHGTHNGSARFRSRNSKLQNIYIYKNTTVEPNLSVIGVIAFDLTQCISGNGEVVMKIVEVGKLHAIKMLAIIHFYG